MSQSIMKKNIAILRGGDSSEIIVSIKSAAVVFEHIYTNIYRPFIVHIEAHKWLLIEGENEYPINKDDFSCSIDGEKIIFDGAFMAIHGTPGEDGKLQAYFDLLDIPYTCSGTFEASLTFNKGMCNALLKQYDIPSAKAILINKGDPIDTLKYETQLSLPCFVKPNRAGSSFGISKVKNSSEWNKAIEGAFIHDDQVIIESFVDGTEVTCGIIENGKEIIALPLTEIVTENDFFDYEAKYEGKSQEITPARVSASEKEQVQTISKRIYRLLKLKGMVRMDYIIEQGKAYLIEINTVPGLSEESIIPQQAKEYGISMTELFGMAINNMFSND